MVAARIETRESAGPSAGRSRGSGVPVERSSLRRFELPGEAPEPRAGASVAGWRGTKLPLRPRETMRPTSESACQAWLTVAGLIFEVGRELPNGGQTVARGEVAGADHPRDRGRDSLRRRLFHLRCDGPHGVSKRSGIDLFARNIYVYAKVVNMNSTKCLRRIITKRVCQWRSA